MITRHSTNPWHFPVFARESLSYQSKRPFISWYLAVLEENNTSWLGIWMNGLPHLACLWCWEELLLPSVPEGVGQVLNMPPLARVEVWRSRLTCRSRNNVHLLCEKSGWCEYKQIIGVSCHRNKRPDVDVMAATSAMKVRSNSWVSLSFS